MFQVLFWPVTTQTLQTKTKKMSFEEHTHARAPELTSDASPSRA